VRTRRPPRRLPAHNARNACSSSAPSTSITAEPSTIAPQFVSDPFCAGAQPFSATLNLTIDSAAELFLQRIGFQFIDRFGNSSLPSVLPIPSMAGVFPSAAPIPIPSQPPGQPPGQIAFGGQTVVTGARTDAFRLGFDCGVPAAGTLFIVVESSDTRGETNVARTSARIGK
jgi:hypothetical protein